MSGIMTGTLEKRYIWDYFIKINKRSCTGSKTAADFVGRKGISDYLYGKLYIRAL